MSAPTLSHKPKDVKIQPVLQKVDKFSEYGQALLTCAFEHPESPAERLLNVLRLVLSLASSILQTSPDAQDAPCVIVGQHYLTRRGLGHAVDGGQLMVKVQEICSFDGSEAPRTQTWDQQGRFLARLHVKLSPVTKAKTRKLGREGYLKVNLGAEGVVRLQHQAALATAPDGQLPLPLQQQHKSQQDEEEYLFSLPALVLLDPLSSCCQVALKGDISVACQATGWAASVTMSEDGRVTGHMDQQIAPPPRQGSAPSSKVLPGSFSSVGSFGGSGRGAITISSASLGLTGTLIQLGTAGAQAAGGGASAAAAGKGASAAAAAGGGMLGAGVDLASMPFMKLPRVWSAVLDSIMFNDPAGASGRGALDLSRAMTRRLSGYPLATDAQLTAGPGTATAGARSTAAGSTAGQAGEDSDDELLMAGSKAAAPPPSKAVQPHVPPCILAQHAAGKRLSYQLQLMAVRCASDLIARPA